MPDLATSSTTARRFFLCGMNVIRAFAVCDYYVHSECQEFAASNCRECATYTPGKDPSQIVQYHHWTEGNLLNNAKCALCRKSCWSSECLTGYRCAWCTTTVRSLPFVLPQNLQMGKVHKFANKAQLSTKIWRAFRRLPTPSCALSVSSGMQVHANWTGDSSRLFGGLKRNDGKSPGKMERAPLSFGMCSGVQSSCRLMRHATRT